MQSRGNARSNLMMLIILIMLICCMSLVSCSSGTDSAAVQTASPEASSAATEGNASAAPLQSPGIQNLTFHSEALDREMRLSIYLPEGYSAKQHYPVLYFIHGYGGKETDMIAGLGLHLNADRLIEAGQINPLIIVSRRWITAMG